MPCSTGVATFALTPAELAALPPRTVVGCHHCRMYCPDHSEAEAFTRKHERHTTLVLVELPEGSWPFKVGKVAVVAELIARRHDPNR